MISPTYAHETENNTVVHNKIF